MVIAAVRLIQERLKALGHYHAAVDGDRGPATNAALVAALSARSADLPDGWRSWSEKRRAVAFLQLWSKDEGIDAGIIDGWWGPQTDFAWDALREKIAAGRAPRAWRDEVPVDVNPNRWPSQDKVTERFGPHGEPGGFSPPLVAVPCPWILKIAWNMNQTTRKITIHQKCAESLARVLEKAAGHYGLGEIRQLRLDIYGGSYNPRKMRGGTSWSMHSWGIAIDWDPEKNKLKWNRDQASLARPEYDAWWGFWEQEGWLSLGRARNFDWMHVQAAKL